MYRVTAPTVMTDVREGYWMLCVAQSLIQPEENSLADEPNSSMFGGR